VRQYLLYCHQTAKMFGTKIFQRELKLAQFELDWLQLVIEVKLEHNFGMILMLEF
jgi:hypothetical protein